MGTAVHDFIGQRFVVDFSGPEVTADLERLIREGRVGGVILFVKNIRSVSQVRGLTADLQRDGPRCLRPGGGRRDGGPDHLDGVARARSEYEPCPRVGRQQ